MMQAEVRQLSNPQLAAFDHDYVTDQGFAAIQEHLESEFGDRPFDVLDVGGGAGFFVDRLLKRYPNMSATVLDNSALLLDQNVAHPRKRTLMGSGTDLLAAVGDQRFDVVFFNFALHHFVVRRYADTRELQRVALRQATQILSERGRVCVSEIAYEGAVYHNLPSRIAFEVTASQRLAKLTKRLGANTAGCGICFLSSSAWRREFARAGLTVAAEDWEPMRRFKLLSRLRLAAIAARRVANVHYWLERSSTHAVRV